MNFKKLTAALTALAACASLCIPAMAFAEETATTATASSDLTAYLSFMDGGWWANYRYNDDSNLDGTEATITGDGSYTVTVSKPESMADVELNGAQFMAILIPDAEVAYPEMVITVDSIKADDTEIAMNAKNYTSSDDGEVTRTNIYNGWVSKFPDDARSTDGKLSEIGTDGYGYTIINPDDLSGWSTLTVDFTISGMGSEEEPSESETESESETASETETESVSESETESETETESAEKQEKTVVGSAYLNFVDGGWWPKYQGGDDDSFAQTPVEVTGNGTYTVSVTAADLDENAIQEGISGVEFMAVIIPDAYENYSDMVITVDSITADSTEIPMTAKNYTSSDDEKEVRANIYNPWVSKIPADAHSTEGMLSDLTDTSAYSYKIINPEDFAGWKTLSVNFTVSGLEFDKYIEEEAPSTEPSSEDTSNGGTTTTTTTTSKSTTTTKSTTAAKTTTAAAAAAKAASAGGTESPKTGDTGIPLAAGAVAAAAVGALFITRKKND